MKICPACQAKYNDDTQQFCFQDGTSLIVASQADTPTLVISETDTVAARREQSAWQQNQSVQVAAVQPQTTRSNIGLVIGVTILVMLVLFAAGVGGWLYFRKPANELVVNATNNTNIRLPDHNVNAKTIPTSQVSQTAKPSPTQTSNTSIQTNSVDQSQEQNDIFQRLLSWKSTAESLDLDGYMAHYAGTVDYYKKDGASLAFVRADKLRAFSRYDSIKIKLTNISISVDPSGLEASARMDKEWDFAGAKNSSGKVKQLIRLSKINSQWFITAEKDLHVY